METVTSNVDPAAAAPVRSAKPTRAVVAIGVLLALTLAFVAWSLGGGAPPVAGVSRTLPVIAEVPEFSLTERDGRTVTRADLLGSVWVADFIFTRCAGPCPLLSARMRSLQLELEADAGVKLVSIMLDPENDTPAALVHYAKRFQADPDRWWFLTGDNEKEVHSLVGRGFLQSVVPETDATPLLHSTYFVVVDRRGRIRSVHNGMEPESKPLIVEDVRSLLAERREQ